jgi:hypothetical protein
MATINELVGLIERGWAPSHIQEKLALKPYRLRQMLATRRLQGLLAVHQQLAEVVARHKACTSAAQAVRVL